MTTRNWWDNRWDRVVGRWWARLWFTRWYIPWRVVHWLGDREIWCWADLVWWKMHAAPWPSRNARCVSLCSPGELTCYCGFWDVVARDQAAKHARWAATGRWPV